MVRNGDQTMPHKPRTHTYGTCAIIFCRIINKPSSKQGDEMTNYLDWFANALTSYQSLRIDKSHFNEHISSVYFNIANQFGTCTFGNYI